MSLDTSGETTDVVICGCGPTGAMLSVLLGQFGVPNVTLEREREITSDPRGIALDEEGVRFLQACGIYNKVFTDIGQCMGNFRFISGVHCDLYRPPFMVMNYNTTEGGTGHPGFICHKQPTIEKHLRSQIEHLKSSDLRVGCNVTSIHEDRSWVYVSYMDTNGVDKQIRSKFLVGADGKTGFTRKKYLEPRGVQLQQVSQMSYEETWVALNWEIALPTPETHPAFPLWSKGYTSQQVYDSFFPVEFRFLCNPKRAAICSRFGLPRDRLWRFEYVVLPGEDGHAMSSPERMREIVYPYITHRGSQYGLDAKDIIYPEDCIKVLRCRPFKFSARSCNVWAKDRVALCGDAAHVFPPFGGQGIASGFRDAISIAWRLALITRNANLAAEHSRFGKILEGWYMERKQQFDKSLASTIENGNYVTETNAAKIFLREWYLWAIQLVPSWKHHLELGNRREGMVRYEWLPGRGMAFLPDMGGGRTFPQVYCAAVHHATETKAVKFTDDVIFAPHKTGLFQIVSFLDSIRDLPKTRERLRGVSKISKGLVREEETTFILNDTNYGLPPNKIGMELVYRLATGGEFVEQKTLCEGRPQPQYYDPYRLAKEVGGKALVLLRPDRVVFASCDDGDELQTAVDAIHKFWN